MYSYSSSYAASEMFDCLLQTKRCNHSAPCSFDEMLPRLCTHHSSSDSYHEQAVKDDVLSATLPELPIKRTEQL
jgi:hypothetical protein